MTPISFCKICAIRFSEKLEKLFESTSSPLALGGWTGYLGTIPFDARG